MEAATQATAAVLVVWVGEAVMRRACFAFGLVLVGVYVIAQIGGPR